ncbi:MAG: hypothetical protein WAT19_02880 [Ferruginibacter sp.]
MKWIPLAVFSLLNLVVYGQQQIVVHFLYGSVPAKGYKETEPKMFGGKKGGHVSIQMGDSIIGFQPKGTCHIVPKSQNPNGYFRADKLADWQRDTAGAKHVSILIPLTDAQYYQLKNKLDSQLQKTPYDYAVFGMRCAAATYDALEDIGIVKEKGKTAKWTNYFYPQLLRRKMLKLAVERNYTVLRQPGRKSRVWEME